jgi:hypothetical protein
MKFQQRQSVYTNLKQYCHMAKPDAIVEVCEWINGEGWDISFDNKIISLTYGELEAINVLTKVKHPEE